MFSDSFPGALQVKVGNSNTIAFAVLEDEGNVTWIYNKHFGINLWTHY